MQQAMLLLRNEGGGTAKRSKAVKQVEKLCTGRSRRAVRDQPQMVSAAKKWLGSKKAEVRKAGLDLYRCFSPGKFVALVKPLLQDGDPGVVAYAAEIAGRLSEPSAADSIIAAKRARAKTCAKESISAPDLDACVWLTYAPGAVLGQAKRARREKVGDAIVSSLESPHPKIREVAVETLAATRLKKYASAVANLIEAEKKKKFAKPNDAALIGRFKKRRRALAKGE